MTTISEIPEISITKVIRCDSDEEALNVNVKNVLTDCENLDSDDDDTADDCKTNLKGKHMKRNRYRSASGDGTAVGAGTNRHKEVDDSGSDDDNNISISPLLRIKRKPREKNIEDTYTDIEDYNDSDDEDNCINNSINNEVNDNEDMKISINELLDQGFIEESKNLSLECGGQTGTKITTENRNYLNVKSNKNCKNIDDENDDDKDDGGVTDCENVEESDDQLGDNDNYDNYIKINDIKYDDILTLVEENSNKICIQDSIDVCNVPKSAISSESENDEQQPNNSLKLNNRVIYDTSDIENLMFSNDNDDDDDDDDDGNDNDNRYCGRLKHSLSTFAAEEIMLHSSDSEVNSYDDNDGAKSLPPQSAGTNQKQTNIPVFDIQFIRDEKTILRQRKLKKFQHNHQKKSTSNGKNNSNSLLNVKSTGSPQNINENHTDIENLHTSTEQSQTSSSDTSDYDSDFNNFNKNEKSYKSDKLTIPVAVVKTQPLTDMEDFDDNNENDDTGYNNNNLYDIQKYKEIVLPSPTREIIIIVEANHGGPILKVMPLPTNVKIVKLQDEYIDKGFTDCEDFSCNEEILEERKFSIIDNVPIIDTNTIVNTSEKFRKSIEEQQPPSSSSSSPSTSSLSSSAIAKKKKQQSQHHHHHHHHHHHYHHHKKQHPKLYKSSGSNTVIDHHTLEPKTDIEEIQLNLNARRKKIKSKSLSASNTANKNTTSTGTLLKSKSYEKHLNKRKIGKPTTDIEELDAVSDNDPENRKQYTKQQGEIFGNTLNINYVGCKSHGHNESGDINDVLTDIEMLAVDENISDADNCSLEDNIKIKEIDTSIIEEQIYNSVVTSYDTLDVTNETRKKFQNTPMPILPNISTLVDAKNSILTNCKDVTGDDEEKIEEIQQLKVTTIIAIDNVSTAITTGIADIDVIAPLDISTPIDLKNTLHECNNTIVFDKTNEGHQNIKGHEYPDVITEHEIITEDCGECNEVVDDGDIVNVSGSGSGTSVGDIIDIGEEVHVDEETTKNDAKLDEIMHETSDSAKAKEPGIHSTQTFEIIPKPTPRLTKPIASNVASITTTAISSLTTTTTTPTISTKDVGFQQADSSIECIKSDDDVKHKDNIGDRSSGDYTETKKFWENLDTTKQGGSSDSSNIDESIMPIPKPRTSQIITAITSIPTTTSATIILTGTGKFDEDLSQTTSSSKISSEQQVEYSETSSSLMKTDSKNEILLLSKDDDDSIDVCEEKLDDESYPLTLSDRHKSDIDIIKMEEIITFEKKENIDDRKSTSPVLASFYIGESSGDIIKKTPSSSDLEADKTLSEKTPSEFKAELTLDLKFDRMPSEDHKLKQDLNLKLDKSETEYLEKTSCVKKLEDDHYLIEAMEDFPPRPQKAAVVHSPIQPYKSATEYEKSIEIQDDTIIASKLQPQLMKSATILADVQEVTAVQSDWNKINDSFGSSTVTAISTSFASTTTTATTKIDQSIVEKTFAEVKESLDAVQEDLIEVVQDGRHIKQSPSEFEFKILPNIRYPPQLESHQEESPEKNVIKSKEQQHTEESIITSPKQDTTSSSSSIKVKSTNRWSTTDPDNYSASSNSYYESFEKTDNSRPLSSDVENLLTFGNSSEYQTAQDASSLLPSIGNRNGFGRKGGESMGSSNTTTTTTTTTITSDFYTAHGTIDNSSSSGQTLSSHESMKSFDSESSGHLGSIEISEASETLVPSTMDIDLPCDTTHSDSHFDIDDNELKLSSLEACSGILLEDYNNELEPISSCMKRSQEMIFQQESKPISLESFDTTKRDSKDDTYNDDKKYSFDDKFGSSYDESKIGTSLEDCGSVLSMSLSSQSNVDTVVELNQQLSEDMASSFGSSLIGSYELKSMLRDDIITAATSFEEPCSLTSMERIDNLIMTTSIVQDGDINSVNTQITTTTTTAPPSIIGDIIQFGADSMNDQINNKKSKGHKRTDSTTFLKGLETVGKPTVAPPPPPPTTTTPITTPTTTTSKEQPPSSSDFSLDDEMIIHDDNDDHFNENEPLSQKDYSGDEKKGGNESDSDYDRYETEYSRSFKQPTKQRDLRGKKNINEKIVEVNTETLERKKSIPSIETIVEDIAAEIELDPTIEQQSLRKSQVSPSQNMQDYSNIPDIKITDDPTKYIELETKVTKQFVEPKGEAIILEKIEPKGVQSPVQYARESVIKVTEEEYQDMIEKQYKAKVADMTTKFEFDDDEKGGESPTSDSFEMLEQPDIADEFVIIEEVAKEANEFDAEGKSVSIKHLKYVKKHDEDVETILVKSAPAATNEGSIVYQQRGRNDLGFEFEESPPQGGGSGGDSTGDSTNGSIDSSRKWVEMQLVDQAQNLRYQYDMERGILEDIKEEDTDFEVGSSRISSFKDSYSSSTPDYDAMAARRYYAKEHDDVSMSSLQEFESLEQAISLENRKFHQGSQDSLSNGSYPKRHVARSGPGDDISLSSLKEFEGLENACLEAHLIEIKAKEEAALLLSRSDESNKSNKSDKSDKGNKFDRVGESDRSQIIKTNITGGVAGGNINRTVTTKITSKDNGDGKTKIIEERIITTTPTATSSGGTGSVPFLSGISTQKPIDNFIKQKCDDDDDLSSNLMEISSDSLEIGTGATAITGGGASISGGTGGGSYSKQQKTTYSKDTSHHGSNDSLDISKSVGDIMTSSMDSIEISKEKSSSKSEADSIEQLCDRDSVGDDNTVDSIEKQYALMEHATRFDRDSIDSGKVKFDVHTTVSTSGNQTISTKTITSTTSKTISFDLGAGTSSTIAKDISTDSLNIMQSEPELLLTSTESLDRSSSTAATNATYQNESDSQMSGSMTSCGSNTLIDTLDGTSNYSMDMYQASSSSTSSTTATTIQYGGSGSGCGIGDGDELTSLKTSVYRTRTKDGDKPYEFFEIFDKDYDKTDTLPRKKGDVPEERREPKND